MPEGYPFSIPAIATLGRIELRSPVTFFAGENGTGKSTLLEGIAAAAKAIPVRGEDAQTEAPLSHAQELAGRLRLIWSRRPGGGSSCEEFFDYAKRLAALAGEMEETAKDFGERLEGHGLGLAVGAVLGPIHSQLTFLLQDAMNSNTHRLLSVHTRITGVAVQPDGVEILAGYAG